jgi:hypothetical protein
MIPNLSSDLGTSTGLSDVCWTRTTVGGPNYLGGSVTKARLVQRFAQTCRGIQKLKAKRSFLERLAHATAAPRTTRPVALTPRRDRRRLWRGKRAMLRLSHNDRVKKGTPRHSISYPFPLSLSYNRDQEGGIPRKGSFSVKETGSEPPY